MKEKVRRSTRDMRTRKVQWWEEGIKKSWWKELAMDKMVVTITITNPSKWGVKAAKKMKEDGKEERGRGQEISVMSGRCQIVGKVTDRKESGMEAQSQ